MKASDRTILIGLIVVGLFAAFWFLALAPKREEASELGDKITQLESDVSAQEQAAEAARQAQDDYESNFSSLVVLGKAAPADGDTPSLLRQLVDVSEKSKTTFGSLALGAAPDGGARARRRDDHRPERGSRRGAGGGGGGDRR